MNTESSQLKKEFPYSAGPTAKVICSNDDGRLAVVGFIEYEIRSFFTRRVILLGH